METSSWVTARTTGWDPPAAQKAAGYISAEPKWAIGNTPKNQGATVWGPRSECPPVRQAKFIHLNFTANSAARGGRDARHSLGCNPRRSSLRVTAARRWWRRRGRSAGQPIPWRCRPTAAAGNKGADVREAGRRQAKKNAGPPSTQAAANRLACHEARQGVSATCHAGCEGPSLLSASRQPLRWALIPRQSGGRLAPGEKAQ